MRKITERLGRRGTKRIWSPPDIIQAEVTTGGRETDTNDKLSLIAKTSRVVPEYVFAVSQAKCTLCRRNL